MEALSRDERVTASAFVVGAALLLCCSMMCILWLRRERSSVRLRAKQYAIALERHTCRETGDATRTKPTQKRAADKVASVSSALGSQGHLNGLPRTSGMASKRSAMPSAMPGPIALSNYNTSFAFRGADRPLRTSRL